MTTATTTIASSLRDWEQGSMLAADLSIPSLLWAHREVQSTKPARAAVTVTRRTSEVKDKPVPMLVTAERPPKSGERAMVISHSCDIVRAPEQVPLVEIAKVFETKSAQVIAESENIGSFRYYRLDRGGSSQALVLDYSWRTHVDKGVLLASKPDESVLAVWDAGQRKTFARWLGRRYSRPAVSDADHERICRPVQERWRELTAEAPHVASEYSREYPEMRYGHDDNGNLVIYALALSATPDESMWIEITGVLREALEPGHPGVGFASDKRSYHTFTKADELATEQIDLMFGSHEKGQTTGALPP